MANNCFIFCFHMVSSFEFHSNSFYILRQVWLVFSLSFYGGGNRFIVLRHSMLHSHSVEIQD